MRDAVGWPGSKTLNTGVHPSPLPSTLRNSNFIRAIIFTNSSTKFPEETPLPPPPLLTPPPPPVSDLPKGSSDEGVAGEVFASTEPRLIRGRIARENTPDRGLRPLLREAAVVPILSEGRSIGVLSVNRETSQLSLTDESLALLARFSKEVSAAILKAISLDQLAGERHHDGLQRQVERLMTLDESLPAPTGPRDITRDREAFTRLVRNEIFRFLRMLANESYQEIDETFELDQMFPEAKWKYTELGNAMDVYYDGGPPEMAQQGHQWIRLDPGARNKINTNIIESDDRQTWIIEQTLVDNEELNDFQLIFSLSIADAKANSTI